MSKSRARDSRRAALAAGVLALFGSWSSGLRAGAETSAQPRAQAPASVADTVEGNTAKCGTEPCEAPTTLTVVYQSGIIVEDDVNTRAAAVLKAACPPPDCTVVLRDALRHDVIASVRSGAAQVGLVGLPPAEADRVAETHHLGKLDALLVTPPGYSVVAKLAEPPSERRWSLHDDVAAALVYVVLFFGLLIGCVLLMNWQPPLKKGGSPTKLDPHLRNVSNAMYWIFFRWSGRLVGAVWLLVGLGFFALFRPATEDAEFVSESSDAPSRGVIAGAYPGRHVSQLRENGDWTICDDVYECFRNLREKRATALAGDRDLLCHFQAASGGAPLAFKSDEPFLPVLQAFVFPNSEQGKAVAKLLRRGMNESATVSNPWRPCELPKRDGTAVGALR